MDRVVHRRALHLGVRMMRKVEKVCAEFGRALLSMNRGLQNGRAAILVRCSKLII